MPFKSKDQWKFFFSSPDIPKSMAERWAKHTKKKFKDLPKKTKRNKKSSIDFLLIEKLSVLFNEECEKLS